MRKVEDIAKELQDAMWHWESGATSPTCKHEDVLRLTDELLSVLLAEGIDEKIVRHVLFNEEIDELDHDEVIGSAMLSRRLSRAGLAAKDIAWRYQEAVKKEKEAAGLRIKCASGVIEIDGGKAIVWFPYSPSLVASIKTIPGRRWNAAAKQWEIPASEVERAVEILGGRI